MSALGPVGVPTGAPFSPYIGRGRGGVEADSCLASGQRTAIVPCVVSFAVAVAVVAFVAAVSRPINLVVLPRHVGKRGGEALAIIALLTGDRQQV